MDTMNLSISLAKGKKHTTIGLLFLAGLLFLRFPFLIGSRRLLPERPTLPRTISMFVFIVGTYLLTAILIWWGGNTCESSGSTWRRASPSC
jgi:hypothetical protein